MCQGPLTALSAAEAWYLYTAITSAFNFSSAVVRSKRFFKSVMYAA